jgi:hypothetical protein
VDHYLFLDGYRKVLEGQAQGRMRNIELILPVVELRLSAFGGTKNKLSRVNFHVIFSDDLGPDLIEAQFLNGLARHYRVAPAYQHLEAEWRALPTRESLEQALVSQPITLMAIIARLRVTTLKAATR